MDLSIRQQEILTLLVQGKSSPQIARQLGISPDTVSRHLTRLYEKTGCENRTQAAVWGVKQGKEAIDANS